MNSQAIELAEAAALRAGTYANECRKNGCLLGCLNWLKVADEWLLITAEWLLITAEYERDSALAGPPD